MNNLSKRIYGGFVVPSTMAPFVVSLSTQLGKVSGMCGGTIISPRHIVTAAHCVIPPGKNGPTADITIGHQSADKDDQAYVHAKKVTLHPRSLVKGSLDMDYDIAVVEVPELTFDIGTQRAVIYNEPLVMGQAMLAMGWGKAESESIDRTELRGLITSVGNCNGGNKSSLTSDGPVICSLGDNSPGRSICSGDSGTAIVVNDGGVLKLTALNSMISLVDNAVDCGSTQMVSFYLRIPYFIDFLVGTTGLSKEYLTGLASTNTIM
ncbi:hypothetical protein LPJ66_000829 [Kickxella alabastrina]|uniref:Uncharacterized protein n=1 Tax=Kickxella alabastrina TaxID=61397 RepID=A0ACC1IV13_9FUNG|nr:hypothetical protein LPJ66_000829 [Kickxella alabastrina]